MSLEIVCDKCGKHFWVDGWTTPDSFEEPGEVVSELKPLDEEIELCECLNDGESFAVIDEEDPAFDDDVI